jgi:hypothetical protein
MQKEIRTASATGRTSDTRWLVKKSGGRIMVDGVTISLRDMGAAWLALGRF